MLDNGSYGVQDLTNMDVVVRHPEFRDWVLSIAVSNTGLLATGGLLNKVYIWVQETGDLLHTIHPTSPAEFVTGQFHVAFHPTLPYFGHLEPDGTVSVVETLSWKPIASLADSEDEAVEFAFDPCLPRIAIGTQSGALLIWDIAQHASVARFRGRGLPYTLSFSADSSLLAVVSDDGSCLIHATNSGAVVH